MKKLKKISALFLAMILCIAMMAVHVSAAPVSQDGVEISLTTDKGEYGKTEKIVAALTVKNTNEFAVTNLSLENFVPDGYKLADGETAVKQLLSLEAGETAELTVTYVPVVSKPGTSDSPNTDDTTDALTAAVMTVVAAAAAFFAFKLRNSKAAKNVLSLVLCVAVMATVVGVASFNAFAAEAESKTVPVETVVKVNGADLTIKAEVKYTLPETDDGMIIGKVCQAGDRVTPIANATVSFCQDSVVCATVTTDTEGAYALSLEAGDYTVEVAAEGYLPFNATVTISGEDTLYLETFFLVEISEEQEGIASGKIVNAFTGAGLGGVTLEIRSGWGVTDGEVVRTVTTASDGSYLVSLPLGNYTMHATKSGFIATDVNIIVKNGETGAQNGAMSPVVADGEYRIVLTWGELPHDLDAHMQGKYSDGTSFHVYYNHVIAKEGDLEVCNLDVDDRVSYGPETITLKPTTSEPYYYYVKNYSEAGSFAISGAQVKVYRGDTLVATYNAPTDQGDGFCWNVFAIINGEIVVQNTVTSMPQLGGAVERAVTVTTEETTVEETTAEEITAALVEEETAAEIQA